MESDQRREKLDIVWGCVFLTGFAAMSWMILISLGAVVPVRMTSCVPQMLTISAAMSVVTVPLMLSVPGNGPALLAGGRILLWLQTICLVSSLAVTVSEMM